MKTNYGYLIFTDGQDIRAGFLAACLVYQGRMANIPKPDLKTAVRHAIALFEQGNSGASAYQAGIHIIRKLAGNK